MESNRDLFASGDLEALLGADLCRLWISAEARVINLETPVCREQNPISKCGVNLFAPLDTIVGISGLKPTVLSLANNHILDQGGQGLSDTINILDEYGISHLGAGANLERARKPLTINLGGKSIGIYSCAEHEFTIAGLQTPGANPFDPLESLDEIALLKQQVDFVLVLHHGGKEFYQYPSPQLQKVCRKMVERGADLVVCQHSHCVGCMETYRNGMIVYGQGDFIFDWPIKNEIVRETSIALDIEIGDSLTVEYIPFVKKSPGIRLAMGSPAEEILNGFHERSRAILQPGFLEQEYNNFAERYLKFYLATLNGRDNLLAKIIRKLCWNIMYKLWYPRQARLNILNMVECEAHRELLTTAIKNSVR